MVTIGLFKIALLYHCLISSFQKLALGAETECIEANIDFYGEDTKFAVAETALACACECRKQAGCLVFSWIAKDNACWMKTSEKGRRKKIGVYSGSVDCCQGIIVTSASYVLVLVMCVLSSLVVRHIRKIIKKNYMLGMV